MKVIIVKSNLLKLSFITVLLIFCSLSVVAQVSMITSESEKKILEKAKLDNLLPSKPNEIAVIGQVKSPQIITKDKDNPLKVSEAIKMAGGSLENSEANIIILQRIPGYGYIFTIFISLDLIKIGKHQDLILEEGDIVVVKNRIIFPTIPLKEYPLTLKIPPRNV